MAQPEIQMIALKDHLANDGRRLKGDPAGKDGSHYSLHSEREAAEHVRIGLGLRLSKEPPKEGEASAPAAEADGDWDLQVSPEAYLERWPDNPKAEQARAAIAKKAAAGVGRGAPAPEAKPLTTDSVTG